MPPLDCRSFLSGAVASVTMLGLGGWLAASKRRHLEGGAELLRPPGAIGEEGFLARCIRCRRCSEACPNDTIRFLPAAAGVALQDTPTIVPTEKGCILCMKCTQACPTGALTPIGEALDEVLERVHIGVAEVDPTICNSYNGYTCGACFNACPFPEEALIMGTWERPVVNPEYCVGCGLCEQQCIHYPKAIRVRRQPTREVSVEKPIGHPYGAFGEEP